MKIVVIDKNSLNVVYRYEDSAPSQHKYGGVWGSSDITVHLECPSEMNWECVKGVIEDDVIVVQEDQDLLDAFEEGLWVKLRGERNRRLSDCDWTQLPDSPLNAQDKTAWADYRQELRDLPEETVDPSDVTWPVAPDVQI